ncbi:unnamed protein product (macronuclear) [Paramecium tetraurelia]|uniref:Uncharacterized protein n=1 Tax=Paramecium tetraurelia TaxID=5888 RepID=A0DCQ2_PARTE|nr:uncharacterized protein GSPATT00039410001 [Paramecium tetraurelia]CAK80819.1 unnamed protein product [Paramecium tetraurelia]|eukprot:XP_001448216.1 hypothetical protein (macronuclear) [Paramecium tetraurelia strain d4-2]
MLQWEIISYFKNDRLQNFDEIIVQIEGVYDKIVKNSNEWKYHYLWVQMVGQIIQYNPFLTKHKLSQQISELNIEGRSDQIWKEFQKKGLLILMNHTNGQAVIQLEKLHNKQLSQIDRTILETVFKESEIFLLLKDFLINEQFQNIPFSFGSYLNSKFENFEGKILQNNENILTIQNIKRFLCFLIPSKLLTLIQQNDENLDEVIKICKNFMVDKKGNETTICKISQQQIKRIIQRLEDYFQNIYDIIKLMSLNQNYEKEMCFDNKDFEELNNLLRLQERFQLFIILDERIQAKGKNGFDHNHVIQDWIQLILEELKKELNFSFHNKPTIYQEKKQNS